MFKVYGDIQSGNCYKIKLLMNLLEIDHQWIHVDILADETHTRQFEKMNPNSRIPVLDLDNGEYLSESNAILNFLAAASHLLPDDGYLRARVLQWQFFEQYSHEPYIATARFIRQYLGLPKEREAEYHAKQEGGHKALAVMEQQLVKTPFLMGDAFSIADISLFAYTHVAAEGGFELEAYGAIRRWISAIEQVPNFIGMHA